MVNRFTTIAYYPYNHNYNFLEIMKGNLIKKNRNPLDMEKSTL